MEDEGRVELYCSKVPPLYPVRVSLEMRQELIVRSLRVSSYTSIAKESGIPVMKVIKVMSTPSAPMPFALLVKLAELARIDLWEVLCSIESIGFRRTLKPNFDLEAIASLIGYSASSSSKFKVRERSVSLILRYDDDYQLSHIMELLRAVLNANPGDVVVNREERKIYLLPGLGVLLLLLGAPTRREFYDGWEVPGWLDRYPLEFLKAFQSGRLFRSVPSRGCARFYFKAFNLEGMLRFVERIRDLYAKLGVRLEERPRLLSDRIIYLEICRRAILEALLHSVGFTSLKKMREISLLVER
ncbi:MAG: hypothetical protein BA066_07885 [Candidatus Korarchaeota archaeon NZ13-K]|nr:MAG: hypothetical protein BA066_07885 [Candidatus Korarchaeota archaeon NZ13-K]